MPLARVNELIDQAEAVLTAAQRLLGEASAPPPGQRSGDEAVLALYDRLRSRLAEIDDRAISELITRVDESVEGLTGVEQKLARVRRLRAAIEQL